MKKLIKSALRLIGIEVRRAPLGPGSARRPIGRIESFLEDIKARGFRPRGLIDVGANRGDWSRLALSVFPSAPIIMIEPQDEMENALNELIQKHPNCHYIKAGVGRTEGELVQTIWADHEGSSFLPEVDNEKLRSGNQRKTRITTIDKILSKIHNPFHPDLIKLDIQGFELEALAGAGAAFGATEVFILETSLFSFMPSMPITREVICFMNERGYELYDITDFLRRPHDGALGQVDLVFVKREGCFRQSANWE